MSAREAARARWGQAEEPERRGVTLSFTFGCPGRGCAAVSEYAEAAREEDPTTAGEFAARAKAAAASRGWVPVMALPPDGRDDAWLRPGWLVCPSCARELALVTGTWRDDGGPRG